MPKTETNGVSVWRMGGGNQSRCGLSAHTLSEKPKLTNTLKASGSVAATPVFSSDASVYFADRAGGVQAYNTEGRLLWRRELPGGFQASPATNQDGSILYLGSVLGRVHALDAKTGKQIWEVMLPAKRDRRIQSDLLVLDKSNVVITSSWGGKYVALSGKDGEQLGEWNAGDYPRTPMSASEDETLFGVRVVWSRNGNNVEVFKTSLGGDETVLHEQSVHGTVNAFAAPVVWHDGLIVPMNRETESTLYYIYQKPATPKKLSDFKSCIHATPSVYKDGTDKLFVATMSGYKLTLPIYGDLGDQSTGGVNVLPIEDVEYFLASPISDANGLHYLGSPFGYLYQIGPGYHENKMIETNRAFEAQPAISPDGKLYAPCTDGNVYVFA
ncbi:PQQ-binding-like beta-propeller repeat protein [bacterium]|nr:PQQ-binding-like beta-propeller repeat protein [bacterium]